MFSRPGREESDEDLLQYQREFLAGGSAPSSSVSRVLNETNSGSTTCLADETAALNIDKRPHDRDVVQLQGNENVEVFPNPPRKKSKFKEDHSMLHKQKNLADENTEDVDPNELLDRHDTHVSVVLSKIVERDTRNCPVEMPAAITTKGFPTVLHRNMVQSCLGKENGGTKPKRSLFARQFEESEADFGVASSGGQAVMTCDDDDEGDVEEDLVGDDSYFSSQSLITGEGLSSHDVTKEVQKIHEENLQKLSTMSQEEIMQEQSKLKDMLDPSILKFLQERQLQSNAVLPESEMQGTCKVTGDDDDDEGIDSNIVEDMKTESLDEKPGTSQGNDGGQLAEQALGTNISEKWLHMDQVEPEKLEWMRDCPVPVAKKSGSTDQVRFDFEGKIVVGDVPEFFGLHHHGNDPGKPGYTLEELFLLARSNFLQQRVLAINILAKIIEKDKQGIFRDHLEHRLLPVLLEAGLVFLLRWSLDNNTDTLIAASVHCFTAILVEPTDELAADILCCGWYRAYEVPCLSSPCQDDNMEEENNMSDIDVVHQDLTKGLLQMHLVPRLRYILEVCHPSSPIVLDILDILIRLARHSTQTSHAVAKCPRLLETVMTQFVPSSWKARDVSAVVTDARGHPLSKALKLFRVLCCAGRNLADTLVHKFALITKILRFITVPADQMQLDVTEALELAVESFRIWSCCVSYGLACHVFSDAYSTIITQLQGLSTLSLQDTSPLSQHNTRCGIALVTLIDAIIHVAGSKAELQAQLTTRLSQDGGTFSAVDASHLPPSPVDWSHVTGLLPVIGHCVQIVKEQFVNLDESLVQDENFGLLSSIFNLLASFYQKLVKQPSYCAVECLDEIEKFVIDSVCVPIMTSKTMEKILLKLRDYSCYNVNEISLPSCHLSNHFDYGCAGQLPRCLQDGTPFAFLLSFTRLAMVITSCHKGVTAKFLTFVTNTEVIDYLKTNSTSGRNGGGSQCFFVKVEQHFQYFLVKLFYNVLLQCGPVEGQLVALYHTVSLLLFSRLLPGDEYYAHDLMSTVIFNPAFFHESKDESAATLTSDLSEMGIDSAVSMRHGSAGGTTSSCVTRASLLSEAHQDLLSIRSTFMASFAQMRHALAKSRARSLHQPQNITSFLLPVSDGTLLPLDWMFLPLLELHNNVAKTEPTSPVSPSSGSSSVVKRTLQWVLLLEEWRPIILHKVPHTARIARLMCTFLCSSDLFLDKLIHNYLKTLFHSYTHSNHLAWLDFNLPIPGIMSFYDLFSSFLIQYEAVSYGDALFSSFVLLPLQQRYNDVFRKTVWNEHASLFRSFSLPLSDTPVPIEYYLAPPETNVEILTLQLRALATGTLRPEWSPVFYLIAVHHLSSFIFTKPDCQVLDERSAALFNQKLKLLNQVLSLPHQVIRNDIVSYRKPSRDSVKGFEVFPSLPPTRQLLLRGHHDIEQAWVAWNQDT